jgi:regulatory protein
LAGLITAIRIQKKNPRRANLYLDDKFVLGLATDVVQDFGLHRGQALSDADLEALRRAERQRRALQDALRLLNYRARSTDEVRKRLAGKGYDPEQVEAVVARLQAVGLLDDAAFARTWVENRQALHPRGRSALAAELRQKGVPAEAIAAVLGEGAREGEEAAQALELASRRARSLRGLDRPAFFRRLQGFLARRGFSPEVVFQAVRRAWEEAGGEDPTRPI